MTFSQIAVTAFRKSSLVSHSFLITTTAATIAAIMSPVFENNSDPSLMIVPTLEINFPTTSRSGPIAAARSAITTIFFFVPALKLISLFVSGEMYFCSSSRMIGMRISPNWRATSSNSDSKILSCPCKVSTCIAAISFAAFVPVIASVISRTASPPAANKDNIPGPALAPNTSIACAVVIPAFDKVSRIEARSFEVGSSCSKLIPRSSNTFCAAEVGFISATSDWRKDVPAIDPS